MAILKQRDAIRQFLDFAERVRSKQQRCAAAAHDFHFQETAKFGGRERVEAAGGLVQKQHGWGVEKSAGESQALEHSARVGARLAVQDFLQAKQLSEFANSAGCVRAEQIVHRGEQAEISASGQTTIKSFFAARVVAEQAASARCVARHVAAADVRASAGGQKQRGQHAKKSGFAGAVRPDHGHGFARLDRKRNPSESTQRGARDRLQESAPSGMGRRKILLEIFDDNCA